MSAEQQVNKPNLLRRIGATLVRPFSLVVVEGGFKANDVTRVGRALSTAGTVILMEQERVARVISDVTGKDEGRIRRWTQVVGGVVWVAGIACDALDGDVARNSPDGPTKRGKVLDAVVDRQVDLLPWVLHNLNSLHPVDRLIAEANLLTNSLPAYIKSIAGKHGIEPPELAIGSRFPRLAVLTVAQLFPSSRRVAGVILVGQSVATAITRYLYVRENGDAEAIKETDESIIGHFKTYLRSKSNLEGFTVGFATRRALVDRYRRAKEAEVNTNK